MHKVLNTKILILGSFLGLSSTLFAASPASASLILGGSSTNNAGLISNTLGSGSTLLGAVVGSDTSVTTGLLGTPTQIIGNTLETTLEATLNNGLTATLEETTNTDIGAIVGASTDSQTGVTIVDPNQLVPALISTLNNPENLLQPDGQLNLGITINNEGINIDTNADLSLGIGDLAQVNICLDGSASIGSPDGSSLANCPQSNQHQQPTQPKEVPEPAAIGSLVIVGAYLLTRKKLAVNL
ncbi:MAG TPA: PEP-CTERM sorting domain-containing protein [Nostocaceae cyanobacterium]|nr:PEP-CTERM sorting domain-containing protein [Nostocaceae cyanobacterium]